jgi:hypothetical protein
MPVAIERGAKLIENRARNAASSAASLRVCLQLFFSRYL